MSVEVYEVKVFNDGTRFWYQNNNLHRLDGPAVEWSAGSKEWWIDGKCHRLNNHAVEHTDGTKYWYQNNKLHRLDGPAIELANGTKEWWIEGIQIPEPKPESIPATCNGKIVEIDGKKYKLQLQEI